MFGALCAAIQHIVIFKIWVKETKQKNRHKTTATATNNENKKQKLYAVKSLWMCVFVFKLQLPHFVLFGEFFLFLCSSCGSVYATVDKGFFFSFCFVFTVWLHIMQLLQFKLLRFPILRIYATSCLHELCLKIPKFFMSFVYRNMHLLRSILNSVFHFFFFFLLSNWLLTYAFTTNA